MDHTLYKKKLEYGVASVTTLIGIFFAYQASTIRASNEAIGPQSMPTALAIGLILGGVWLAIRAHRGKVGDIQEGYGFLDSNLKRIALVVACGALFVLTFWLFGYFIAIIVGYISTLMAFGVKEKVKTIAGALVMAIVMQWLFMGVMRLNDPKGVLIDVRPYTNLISGD